MEMTGLVCRFQDGPRVLWIVIRHEDCVSRLGANVSCCPKRCVNVKECMTVSVARMTRQGEADRHFQLESMWDRCNKR